MVLHAVAAAICAWAIVPGPRQRHDLVDIEMAPAVPAPETLPAEIARPLLPAAPPREPEQTAASRDPDGPSEPSSVAPVDAGVDAQIDAAPDARPDARVPPDAGVDAPDAGRDASPPDALEVASTGDAASEAPPHPGSGATDDAPAIADDGHTGSGSAGSAAPATSSADGPASRPSLASALAGLLRGAPAGDRATGSGAAIDTAALAAALAAAAPGAPGIGDAPAVDGAPTTAGTAANLLSYLPDGHLLTALVRLDRLRGTEWAAQTERLLRPMPDYQLLFGARDAEITDKLETLVISTPRPRDAATTTLVARTRLSRQALRDALAASAPVTWSVARGGLLGRRGSRYAADHRVFLSPFPGWFLLAQPGDLGALTAAAPGKLDTAVASGAMPPWITTIRDIERESGDVRGPALVVTVALGGKRFDLRGNDFGLGIASLPTPERVSLAAELVPQGWIIRGNLRLASDTDADELVRAVQQLQQRIADSRTIQLVLGKPIARVIAALAFARNGPRVSYATAMSIADARAILAAVAQYVDQYFGRAP